MNETKFIDHGCHGWHGYKRRIGANSNNAILGWKWSHSLISYVISVLSVVEMTADHPLWKREKMFACAI
jgi:hypothetical protein